MSAGWHPDSVTSGPPGPARGLLFDIDGVFFVGEDAIAGGAETIAWADAERVPYLFVTNTTSHPRSYLADKLRRCGVPAEPQQILTPAVAAHEWLTEHGREPVALFVPDATAAEFGDLVRVASDAESGAAAVVVGDLGEDWTFAHLNRAFRLLTADPKPALVALGMARFWKDADRLEEVTRRAEDILALLGLQAKRHLPAAALSHGEQRYLEIGVALATEPDFLLLDEPTAGMSPEETRQTAAFVRTLAGRVTIVLVEHDMEVVMGISDRITVLNYGQVLAEGTPAEIRDNAEVRRVYLRD